MSSPDRVAELESRVAALELWAETVTEHLERLQVPAQDDPMHRFTAAGILAERRAGRLQSEQDTI